VDECEPLASGIAPNAALGSAVFALSVATLPVDVPPTLPDLAFKCRVAVTGRGLHSSTSQLNLSRF
jgi:hypothetical protein